MTDEIKHVGLKVGSQNTVAVFKDVNNELKILNTKTCVKYTNKTFKNMGAKPPIIGNDAVKFADAIWPLSFGIIKSDEGVQQTIDILRSLGIPSGADVVLASPAIEITDGKDRLSMAVKEACKYKGLWVFSEGVCSVVHITGKPEIVRDSTFFSVNLGSSTTELCCSNEGTVKHLSAHSDLSGNRVDYNILNHVRNSIGEEIPVQKAREMKENASLGKIKTFQVHPLTEAGYKEYEVSTEITIPLQEYVSGVVDIIRKELYRNIDPIIREAALEQPLFISGGMSNIDQLPERIAKKLKEDMRRDIDVAYCNDQFGHIAPAIGALALCEAGIFE